MVNRNPKNHLQKIKIKIQFLPSGDIYMCQKQTLVHR
jgi:hypothetical protein